MDGFVLLLAACAILSGQQQQGRTTQFRPEGHSSTAGNPDQPIVPSASPVTTPPATASRKPADAESAHLLQLATELKAEVDKSTKDTLSIAVIRKAEAVERAARGMKEKMRASAAAN